MTMRTTEPYDCQRCGACCTNPPENQAEGYTAYIEVEPRSKLLGRKDLVRKYTQEIDGVVHLKLLADNRCAALLGKLGKSVRCAIYQFRPAPCRRVEAGSKLCQRYRADLGIENY